MGNTLIDEKNTNFDILIDKKISTKIDQKKKNSHFNKNLGY